MNYKFSGGKKMNVKSKLKYIWLAAATLSLVLTTLIRFGVESNELQNSTLALNALMFILSLPCSLFFVPVAAAANYYLEIEIFSNGGVYLSTVFLFVLGALQWFWLARVWSTNGFQFQKLELIEDKS